MIEIRNLKKRFKKGVDREDFLLDIPLLEIGENEIVYLVGPNGSGKTTILSIIQGEIEGDSGEIFINRPNGKVNLLDLEPYKRSNFIGYVPQESDSALVNDMVLIDHVLIALAKAQKIPLFFPRYRKAHDVKNILRPFEMGFENRLYEAVGNFSGGERQVLSFCLATLKKPYLLLLDEFTAALDPEMAKNVIKLVINYIRGNKMSALIVTHRQREALANADRIIVLHKGKPFEELNNKEDEFTEEYLNRIFNKLYTTE